MVTLSKSRRDLNRAAAPPTPMDAAEKEEVPHDSTGALAENKRSGGGFD